MISKWLLEESAKYGEYAVSTGGLGGCITSMMELVEAGYWVKVREENQWTAPFDVYQITAAGLAYLYQDAPMVDQPQPAPVDDNDDLPFSDVGADDEDTKPLPVMQHTPCNPTRPTIGDAIKLPLSNLIDASLDPDNVEAYEVLKSYDWASVPLWVTEIEYDDVNYYMWAMWAEAKTDVSKRPHAERAANIRHLLQEITDPREVVE